MSPEPQFVGDYSDRQVRAARQVLVDLGQVLGSFRDVIVVVGGWVPDLLLPAAEHPHIGSLDIDLALDAEKLGSGRYAEILKLLDATGRYRPGEKNFQLVVDVPLGDGQAPVRVDVEFLAPADVKLPKNRPKLVEGFRVLKFAECAVAFTNPENVRIEGAMVSGARNTVDWRVVSLPDFIILKAHALNGRDKPKDVYDICYCLDEFPGGRSLVADNWRGRRGQPFVEAAVTILKEKFDSVEHYGPQQLALFHQSGSPDEEGPRHARRAFELVQDLLSLL